MLPYEDNESAAAPDGWAKTLAGLVFAALPSMAVAGTPTLLVVDQGAFTLYGVDPATGRELFHMPVGGVDGVDGVAGHEIVTSPDGKLAFLPLYSDVGVGKPGRNGSTIDVIDLAARKVVGTVDFGHEVRPYRVLYEPLAVIDLTSWKVDPVLTLGKKIDGLGWAP